MAIWNVKTGKNKEDEENLTIWDLSDVYLNQALRKIKIRLLKLTF